MLKKKEAGSGSSDEISTEPVIDTQSACNERELNVINKELKKLQRRKKCCFGFFSKTRQLR